MAERDFSIVSLCPYLFQSPGFDELIDEPSAVGMNILLTFMLSAEALEFLSFAVLLSLGIDRFNIDLSHSHCSKLFNDRLVSLCNDEVLALTSYRNCFFY